MLPIDVLCNNKCVSNISVSVQRSYSNQFGPMKIETDRNFNGLWREAISTQILFRPVVPISSRRLATSFGEIFVDFATASYLGLDYHPVCVDAFADAVREFGLFQYASPLFLLSPIQCELESAVAGIVRKPKAAVFSNVTLLHSGALPIVARQYKRIFVDEYAHASIHNALRR